MIDKEKQWFKQQNIKCYASQLISFDQTNDCKNKKYSTPRRNVAENLSL